MLSEQDATLVVELPIFSRVSLRLRFTRQHWILNDLGRPKAPFATRPKEVPPGLVAFLRRVGAGGATAAVLAFDGAHIVGAFRFFESSPREVSGPWSRAPGSVQAAGTWVAPSYRELGIGRALWKYAQERARFSEVCVSAITSRGIGLVRAAERELAERDVCVVMY